MSDEVKQQVTNGLYALLSLAIGGVIAFSVYVVNDLRDDIERLRGYALAVHNDVMILKKDVEELRRHDRGER